MPKNHAGRSWHVGKKKRSKLMVVDLMVIPSIVFCAFLLRNYRAETAAVSNWQSGLLLISYPLTWIFLGSLFGAWDIEVIRNRSLAYQSLVKAGFVSFILFSSASFIFHVEISRLAIFFALVCGIALTVFVRWISYQLNFNKTQRGFLERPHILICQNLESSKEHVDSLKRSVRNLTIFFIPEGDSDFEHWLATIVQNIESSDSIRAHLIDIESLPPQQILKLIIALESRNVEILIAETLGLVASQRKIIVSNGKLWSLLHSSPLNSTNRLTKRAFDVTLSLIILTILFPVLVLIGMCVKLSSRGPILYIDKRIGKDEVPFDFPKFRSMYVSAKDQRLEVLGRPDANMSSRYRSDPRITPFGSIIRRFSLDELPQFWCVLRGSMSIVGPRPMLPEEELQLGGIDFRRHVVKPGLTGLWQVSGRKETTWEERMALDLDYIQGWSMSSDLVLVMRTLIVVIRGTGAY